jgi:DNA polymerase III delta subunit
VEDITNVVAVVSVIKLILQNKKFTPDAALALTQMTDNNFARVSGEMEKLCALYDSKPTIEKADVESTVSKTEKYQVFELSTAAFKKDIKKLDAILETLSTDTDDYAIFGNLLSVCRRLFYIKNSPLKPTDLAKSLGVHPFSIISALRDAKQVTADAAKRIYRCALDLEYDIKSGKVLANRATVLLIGEILQ